MIRTEGFFFGDDLNGFMIFSVTKHISLAESTLTLICYYYPLVGNTIISLTLPTLPHLTAACIISQQL